MEVVPKWSQFLETKNSSSRPCWFTNDPHEKKTLGGGFIFWKKNHPYLGKMNEPILTNFLQMGWNHQLEKIMGGRVTWNYTIIDLSCFSTTKSIPNAGVFLQISMKLGVDPPPQPHVFWHREISRTNPKATGTLSNEVTIHRSDRFVWVPSSRNFDQYGECLVKNLWKLPEGYPSNGVFLCDKWVFPKIGVPQNGWFIMENPIKENPIKMDQLGVPLF